MIYNKEVQLTLLSMMLKSPDLFTLCQNILKPSYFDKDLTTVVSFILTYAEKYNGLPTHEIIMANTQTKIPIFSANILNSHRDYFLEITEKFCRHKGLEKAVIQCADLLEKQEYGKMEKIIKDAILISLERNLGVDLFEDPKKVLDELKAQNGNISTGWKSVDKIIYQLAKGELIIFSAISGGGKSVALANICLNWAIQKFNVIYFTFELDQKLVAKRIYSMISGIPGVELYKKIDEMDFSVKKYGEECGKVHIKYLNPGSNTNDLKAFIKEYEIKMGFRPDMIAVDYMDLMAPNSKRIDVGNTFQKDKMVAEELRGTAAELQLIVASAVQVNRSGYEDNEGPNIGNIAGGISKAYTCDLMINIINTPALREKNNLSFSFLKTRNSGGVGKTIQMEYNIETLRILDSIDDSEINMQIKKIINEKPTSKKREIEVSPPPGDRLKSILNKINKG